MFSSLAGSFISVILAVPLIVASYPILRNHESVIKNWRRVLFFLVYLWVIRYVCAYLD
jgi:hypothetical protein